MPAKADQIPLFQGGRDALPVLIQHITDQTLDEEIRSMAIGRLAHLEWLQNALTDDAKAAVKHCLSDPRREIRFAAALTLLRLDVDAESSAKIILEVIADQFNDSSPFERITATYRLHHLGTFKQVNLEPILRKLRELENDRDPAIRWRATEAIDGIQKVRDGIP